MFDWNTKQLFVYVVAEYQGDKQVYYCTVCVQHTFSLVMMACLSYAACQ